MVSSWIDFQNTSENVAVAHISMAIIPYRLLNHGRIQHQLLDGSSNISVEKAEEYATDRCANPFGLTFYLS
jgi:hypothetical protein